MRKNRVLLGVALVLFGATASVWYLRVKGIGTDVPRTTTPLASRLSGIDLHSKPAFARNNILVRELFRQSLLLAERDECGLSTRDPSLGESPHDVRAPGRGLAAHAFVRAFDGVQVQLYRDTGDSAEEPAPGVVPIPATATRRIVYQTIIPSGPVHDHIDYPALLEKAEALSRHEFKTAVGTRSTTAPTATLTTSRVGPGADVDRLLREMNFISQFAAVRAAHGSEASWEVMGVLSRGYANLGQLTSYQYTASSKAFAARSLLYAQRMVVAAGGPAQNVTPGQASAPKLAHALRHRAYAFALAGLQGAALADLDRADQLDPTVATNPPGWVAVLRPYCQYHASRLAEIASNSPADAPLALFLCFLTVERCNSASVTNGYGQVALSSNPDCLRVLDAMVAVSGVSNNHALTQVAPVILGHSIKSRMSALPDLRRAFGMPLTRRCVRNSTLHLPPQSPPPWWRPVPGTRVSRHGRSWDVWSKRLSSCRCNGERDLCPSRGPWTHRISCGKRCLYIATTRIAG